MTLLKAKNRACMYNIWYLHPLKTASLPLKIGLPAPKSRFHLYNHPFSEANTSSNSLPSVTSGINTSQQHRLPISRVTQKGVTKKGRKGQTIWREPQKKHISALWVQFHPKRWSCFIFECYDFFWRLFLEMFWACNCGKISDNSNFTQSTQLLRSTFLWSFGHLFWGGDGFAGCCACLFYPSVFISVRTRSGKWHPQDFHKLYRIVATSSNKPTSFVSVWRSFSVFAPLFCCFKNLFSHFVFLPNSWFEKPPWIRQWIRHEENLPILSMRHPGCLMTGSFYWCSLFWINKNTPFRQQKKSSVDCGDSSWWSMPIFSGPGGVFVARNIRLNSQLSSKFVQFFGKHGWLHKIHSKLKKTRNNKYIHNPLFCRCLNLEWILCSQPMVFPNTSSIHVSFVPSMLSQPMGFS